jgi:iron complex outermembrane receptor protein
MTPFKVVRGVRALFSGCALPTLAICLAATAASAQQAPADQAAPATPKAAQQTTLQEVVVNARRREESVQRVPVSVSVVSSDQLTTKGVSSAADLVSAVPGLNAGAVSDRQDINFGIRGQSTALGTTAAAVVTYFSEVPLNRLSDGQFFDIQGIQVLKGPQGTLFGRVTTGGAVLVNPVAPSMKFEGYGQVEFGDYNLHDEEAAVNMPIIDDKIALRLAGKVTSRDGYTINDFNGRDLDNENSQAVRASLLIRPIEGLENTTIVNYSHAATNGSGVVLLGINPSDYPAFPGQDGAAQLALLAAQDAKGPRHTYIDLGDSPLAQPYNGSYYFRDALWVLNRTSWKLSDSLTLKNIFSFQYNNEREGSGVAGASTIGGNVNPWGADVPYSKYTEYTEEVQAQGNFMNNRVNYTVGAYGEMEEPPAKEAELTLLYNELLTSITSLYPHIDSEALYSQFNVKIIDGLSADLGIRHTWDQNSTTSVSLLDEGGVGLLPGLPLGKCITSSAGLPAGVILTPCATLHQRSDVTTWTAGLDYQITRSVFAYGNIRTGYRPGGVNAYGGNDPDLTTYAPEKNTSYEIGIKSQYRLGGVDLRTNAAAFYEELDGAQRELTILIGGAPAAIIENTAKATTEGFELEQAAVLFKALTLDLNWTHLHSGYDAKSFGYTAAQLAAACPANPSVTAPNETYFCPMGPLPLSPSNTVTASIEYRLPLGDEIGRVTIGGDMYYRSSEYQVGFIVADGTAPGYTIFNANAKWGGVFGKPIDLTLFVTNLANKTYVSAITFNTLEAGGLGFKSGFYGPPRMVGVSAKYHF